MTITPVVENYARERDFSGVTRITGSNGAVPYVDARGLADRDAGTLIAAGMRFQIASRM